jgi:hypothetical protein
LFQQKHEIFWQNLTGTIVFVNNAYSIWKASAELQNSRHALAKVCALLRASITTKKAAIGYLPNCITSNAATVARVAVAIVCMVFRQDVQKSFIQTPKNEPSFS